MRLFWPWASSDTFRRSAISARLMKRASLVAGMAAVVTIKIMTMTIALYHG